MDSRRVGFIGLGIMGRPMSKNLLKAGYGLTVHSRSSGPVDELVGLGAERADSPREVAERSDVVITMLPDGADVEKVVSGDDGVLAGMRKGAVLIDMSSISPVVTGRIAAEVQSRGGEALDAPVSGGETGAVQGTLAIMVGGKRDVFDACLPILKTMGKSVTLVGGPGAGQVAKLANQIIVAVNIEALSEALVFASKAGVDPAVLVQAIRGGLAGSAVMEAKAPKIIGRDFKAGFRIRLHQKDLRNALSAAGEYSVPLPVTSLVQQMVSALVNDAKGDLDHSGIDLFIEGLAKAEVGRKGDGAGHEEP